MGQAAALSGLIGLTGPLAIVLKPPPVTWLGLISANIGYFIYAPFLSRLLQKSTNVFRPAERRAEARRQPRRTDPTCAFVSVFAKCSSQLAWPVHRGVLFPRKRRAAHSLEVLQGEAEFGQHFLMRN